MIDIAIIIYNELNYLKMCVDSLEKYTRDFRCMLINNNSTEEGIIEFLEDYKNKDNFLVINNEYNIGFPLALNQAILNMKSDKGTVFCNQDIYFTPGWLDKIFKVANSNRQIGMVGPSTSFTKCKEQKIEEVANRTLDMTEDEILECSKMVENKFKDKIVDADVTGFCFYVKKEIFDVMGGFDWRSFGIGSGEEAHFRYRLKNSGYRAVVAQESYVHHFGHRSFSKYHSDSRKLWVNNNKVYSKLVEKIGMNPKNNNLVCIPIENTINVRDLKWLQESK